MNAAYLPTDPERGASALGVADAGLPELNYVRPGLALRDSEIGMCDSGPRRQIGCTPSTAGRARCQVKALML